MSAPEEMQARIRAAMGPLVDGLWEARGSDFTVKDVRLALAESLGVDLAELKSYRGEIIEQMTALLQSKIGNGDASEGEGAEEEQAMEMEASSEIVEHATEEPEKDAEKVDSPAEDHEAMYEGLEAESGREGDEVDEEVFEEGDEEESSDEEELLTPEEKEVIRAKVPRTDYMDKIHENMAESQRDLLGSVMWAKYGKDMWPCYVLDPREYHPGGQLDQSYKRKCSSNVSSVIVLWLGSGDGPPTENIKPFSQLRSWIEGVRAFLGKKRSKKKEEDIQRAYQEGMHLDGCSEHLRLKEYRQSRYHVRLQDAFADAEAEKRRKAAASVKGKPKGRKSAVRSRPVQKRGRHPSLEAAEEDVLEEDDQEEGEEAADQEEGDDGGDGYVDEDEAEAEEEEGFEADYEEDGEALAGAKRKRARSKLRPGAHGARKRRRGEDEDGDEDGIGSEEHNDEANLLLYRAMEKRQPGFASKVAAQSKRDRALSICAAVVLLCGGKEGMVDAMRGKVKARQSKKPVRPKSTTPRSDRKRGDAGARKARSSKKGLEEAREKLKKELVDELSRDSEHEKKPRWQIMQLAATEMERRMAQPETLGIEIRAGERRPRPKSAKRQEEPVSRTARRAHEDDTRYLKRLVDMCRALCEDKPPPRVDVAEVRNLVKAMGRVPKLNGKMLKDSGAVGFVKMHTKSSNAHVARIIGKLRDHFKKRIDEEKAARKGQADASQVAEAEAGVGTEEAPQPGFVDAKPNAKPEIAPKTGEDGQPEVKPKQESEGVPEASPGASLGVKVEATSTLKVETKPEGESEGRAKAKLDSSRGVKADELPEVEPEAALPTASEGANVDAVVEGGAHQNGTPVQDLAKSSPASLETAGENESKEEKSPTRTKLMQMLHTSLTQATTRMGRKRTEATDARMQALERLAWTRSSAATAEKDARDMAYGRLVRQICFGFLEDPTSAALVAAFLDGRRSADEVLGTLKPPRGA